MVFIAVMFEPVMFEPVTSADPSDAVAAREKKANKRPLRRGAKIVPANCWGAVVAPPVAEEGIVFRRVFESLNV